MELGDPDLILLRALSEGTFGRVYLCKCGNSKNVRQVCVKRIIVKNPRHEIKMIEDEIYIISQLRHPRIVQFERYFIHADTVNIVMEYLEKGTLRDVIHSTRGNGGIPTKRILNFFLDMLMGLEYLHIRHVTHRDIKPENLLLDGQERIKYADFGISGIQHAMSDQHTRSLGTPLYAAPEILQHHQYEFKSDIWSLGCVLYELCAGWNPFALATNLIDLISLIRLFTHPSLNCSKITDIHGDVFGNICQRMLTYDLNERITLPDIVAFHPLITLPFYGQYFEYDY